MNADPVKAKEIFLQALKCSRIEDRDAYLKEACGTDAELRRHVDILIEANEQAGSFLQAGALASEPTIAQPITEKPGTIIGPYKLLQQIGEGGMGVVYMAEQTELVERRVALKIIKPGMDTRQVIARFEAERQALAMMDHPNIAKVLDAGTTHSGRPFFVMELVKGIAITQYCDEKQLSPRERLELFVPVCQAVHHAHQKGIIHRDIKPSNVIVCNYDDHPVPKIIDFGVAKATSQRLTEKTMFTEYGQIVGTIEYMSPEQANLSQLDIDTRSDIYSLGVLLYELLVGETPFDRTRLRSAAFDELLRIVREEEPPRPSIRLRISETLPSIAVNRQIEPHKLSALVRGELDWIVMKAMEKDRARRYETASTFAEDVQHYLNDEPVVACPPSSWYRMRKLARRNKVAFATIAAVAVALLFGIFGTTWQAIRATRAEREALLERDATRAQRERAVAAENSALSRLKFAEDAVSEYVGRLADSRWETNPQPKFISDQLFDFYKRMIERSSDSNEEAGLYLDGLIKLLLAKRAIGQMESHEDDVQKALTIGNELYERHPEDKKIRGLLASIHFSVGEEMPAEACQEALVHYDRARELLVEIVDLESEDRTGKRLLHDLLLARGHALDAASQHAEAATEYELAAVYGADERFGLGNAYRILEARSLVLAGEIVRGTQIADEIADGPGASRLDQYGATTVFCDAAATSRKDTTQFDAFLDNALRIFEKALSNDRAFSEGALSRILPRWAFPSEIRNRLQQLLDWRGAELLEEKDWSQAIVRLQTAITIQPESYDSYRLLGDALLRSGETSQAIFAYRRAIALSRDGGGPYSNLGLALQTLNDEDGAFQAFRRGTEHFITVVERTPEDDLARTNLRVAARNLASGLKDPNGDSSDAKLIGKAIDLGFPATEERSLADWGHLGQMLYRAGRYADAREALEKVNAARQDDGPTLKGGPRWWYYTMTLWRVDDRDQARKYFKRLVDQLESTRLRNREVHERLQAEASALMGPSSNEQATPK